MTGAVRLLFSPRVQAADRDPFRRALDRARSLGPLRQSTIVNALDRSRYEPVLIGLDPEGDWRVSDEAGHDGKVAPASIFESSDAQRAMLALRDGVDFVHPRQGRSLLARRLDVLFPMIHGRGGEDGTVQGVFELADVPYVGPSVLASALCMDKAVSKHVLRSAGVPVLPCVETARMRALESPDELIERVEARFEYPVFVKPSKTGSSVGIHKARDRAELAHGIKEAARFDLDVLVEPGVDAREIECAVLGGHDPEASLLGEIVPANEFYDYEAKYLTDNTELRIPAPLEDALAERIRSSRCWRSACSSAAGWRASTSSCCARRTRCT